MPRLMFIKNYIFSKIKKKELITCFLSKNIENKVMLIYYFKYVIIDIISLKRKELCN